MIRTAFVALLFFAAPAPTAAPQDQALPPEPLKRPILDLRYRILDLKGVATRDTGGTIQDLTVKESATEIRLELAADVLFDFDQAVIKPNAAAALNKAAAVLRDRARGLVRIEGHTDSKGTDAYNQRLSERRAAAVRDWLVKQEGLTNVRFTTRGFGARQPAAPNTMPDGTDNPEGRQKNRRVEIVASKIG
jgi:outer membrane protein OmpA-like peptidoglycan-associated protein